MNLVRGRKAKRQKLLFILQNSALGIVGNDVLQLLINYAVSLSIEGERVKSNFSENQTENLTSIIANDKYVFVSCERENCIRKFSLRTGELLRSFCGFNYNKGRISLCPESGLAISEKEIFVADTRNKRIHVFDFLGAFRRCWSMKNKDFIFASIPWPRALAIQENQLFVTINHTTPLLQIYSLHGKLEEEWKVDVRAILALSVDGDEIFLTCTIDDTNERILVFSKMTQELLREFTIFEPAGIVVSGNDIYVATGAKIMVLNRFDGTCRKSWVCENVQSLGAIATNNDSLFVCGKKPNMNMIQMFQ